jgi:hypothetical protein
MAPKGNPDVLDEAPRFNKEARLRQLLDRFVLLRVVTHIWDGVVSTESTEVVALLLAKAQETAASRSRAAAATGRKVYKRRGMSLHAFHSMKL